MNFGSQISGAVMGFGALTWMAGMLFGLYQCLLWLKDGYWTYFTPVWIFGAFQSTGWGGVDKILHWIWLQPLWAVTAFAGMALAGVGLLAAQAYE